MIRFDATCNVCGAHEFEPFGVRSDGIPVILCSRCHHGVVQTFTEDVNALYGDDYFWPTSPSGIGYDDYSFTSEHGLSWAAALVELLRPTGKVLDIGCADGHLLRKLGAAYNRFGIEPNQRAAELCRSDDIPVIASDVLDQSLSGLYGEAFDIALAIAVFEHVPDFRGAITAALSLLRPDGLLLFEVPLISADNPNDPWLRTSLEHIHYPTEASLRYLFEKELGLKLAGSGVVIQNFAKTFVGLTSKSNHVSEAAGQSFHRWTEALPSSLTKAEARFRWMYDLIHAAKSDPDVMGLSSSLGPSDINENVVRRILELWSVDATRAKAIEANSQSTAAYLKLVEEARDLIEANSRSIAGYLKEVEKARDWHAGESAKKDEIIEKANADLAQLRSLLSETREQIRLTRLDLEAREVTVRQLEYILAIRDEAIRHLTDILATQEERSRIQTDEMEELRRDWQARALRIEAMEGSLSWKFTRPLRALGRLLRMRPG